MFACELEADLYRKLQQIHKLGQVTAGGLNLEQATLHPENTLAHLSDKIVP